MSDRVIRKFEAKDLAGRFGCKVIDDEQSKIRCCTVSLEEQNGLPLLLNFDTTLLVMPNGVPLKPWDGYVLPEFLRKQLKFNYDGISKICLVCGRFYHPEIGIRHGPALIFRIANRCDCDSWADAMYIVHYDSIDARNKLRQFIADFIQTTASRAAMGETLLYSYDTGQGYDAGIYYIVFGKFTKYITENNYTFEVGGTDFVVTRRVGSSDDTYVDNRAHAGDIYKKLAEIAEKKLDDTYWQTHPEEFAAWSYRREQVERFEAAEKSLHTLRKFFEANTKYAVKEIKLPLGDRKTAYVIWNEQRFLASEPLLLAIEQYVEYLNSHRKYLEEVEQPQLEKLNQLQADHALELNQLKETIFSKVDLETITKALGQAGLYENMFIL